MLIKKHVDQPQGISAKMSLNPIDQPLGMPAKMATNGIRTHFS